MKKKLLTLIGISMLSLSLVACGGKTEEPTTTVNENTINTEETTTEENTDETIELLDEEIVPISEEELNNDVYLFYSRLSLYVEDFNRNYTLIGNAIDDNDESDYNYYYTKLQTIIDDIEKLKEPSAMTDAKLQIVNGFKAYKESCDYLKEAYATNNYDKYNEFIDSASIGAGASSDFLEYCDNLYDFTVYLSSIMETEFYLSNYNLYFKTSEFSDVDNEILYILNHGTLLLSKDIDNAIIAYSDKTDYQQYIEHFNSTIETFNKLEIENENLLKFRDALVDGISNFVPYFEAYFEGLENDTLENNFSDSDAISKNAQNIYDAMTHMQNFYGEYNMTIAFNPTTDYENGSTSTDFNFSENEDGEVEIIENTSQESTEIIVPEVIQ